MDAAFAEYMRALSSRIRAGSLVFDDGLDSEDYQKMAEGLHKCVTHINTIQACFNSEMHEQE